MRAITDKLHRHFNVAMAESDRESSPARSEFTVVTIARSRREARETLERVADAVAAYPRAELLALAISEV